MASRVARVLLPLLLGVLAPSLARADEARAIVFVRTPGVSPATWDAAMLAVRAQLADVPVKVVVASGEDAKDLRSALDRATALAASEKAIGAFWLSGDEGSELLLYLAEPLGARVLVRRVRQGSSAAALEEVAVIARASTSALLEGRTIGMEAVAPPPAKPPPAPPAEPNKPAAFEPLAAPPKTIAAPSERASYARFGVGYAGTSYAPEVPWQSGVGVSAAWFFRGRFRVSASALFVAPIAITTGEVTVEVVRHPFDVELGYALDLDRVGLGIGVAALIEAATRTTTHASPGLAAEPDATRWTFGVAPRARASYAILPPLRLEAGLGLEVIADGFRYVVDAPDRRAILTPRGARPRLDVGLALEVR